VAARASVSGSGPAVPGWAAAGTDRAAARGAFPAAASVVGPERAYKKKRLFLQPVPDKKALLIRLASTARTERDPNRFGFQRKLAAG